MPTRGEHRQTERGLCGLKKLSEQMTSVRDLVRKGGAWTSAQVVSAFKGASADGVENELDRLGELGLLVSLEEQGTRFWQWG